MPNQKYSISNVLGTNIVSKLITIAPLPNAGTITGKDTSCKESTTLSDATPGGSWGVIDSTIAKITWRGELTGEISGINTAYYSVSNICGNTMCKFGFIVSGLPSPVVSGSTYLCQCNKLTLNGLPVGGTWNSNNINDSIYNGIILGLLKGYDTI